MAGSPPVRPAIRELLEMAFILLHSCDMPDLYLSRSCNTDRDWSTVRMKASDWSIVRMMASDWSIVRMMASDWSPH